MQEAAQIEVPSAVDDIQYLSIEKAQNLPNGWNLAQLGDYLFLDEVYFQISTRNMTPDARSQFVKAKETSSPNSSRMKSGK